MKPDPDMTCPYTGHKELCRNHYANCPKWMNVIGTDPQTGASVNQWNCADAWLPLLMIENSQMQRQTGAAVDSFKNEMVKSNDVNTKILLTAAQLQLPALPKVINEDLLGEPK